MNEKIRTQRDGQDLVGMGNEWVELLVAPGVGAKLVQLRDRKSGREWMWSVRPPRPLQPVAPVGAFDDSQLIGMDECLPTVAPCQLDGVALPDHGELWNVPWELDEEALETRQLIRTSINLRTLPLRLERTVVLQEATVSFRYTLRNLSDRTVRFAWAMHPLFELRRGDRLLLEGVSPAGRVDSSAGLEGVRADAWVAWRGPNAPVSLETLLEGGSGQALKLYLAAGEGAGFVVHNTHDGTRLRGTFGPGEALPYLGVWVSRGGWNGYEHFALEPTNVVRDQIERVEPEPACSLDPGATRSWWVDWSLGG